MVVWETQKVTKSGNLKALINAAFIDGVHDNQRAAALIVKKIEDRDKAVEIYLTEEELQALYDMP